MGKEGEGGGEGGAEEEGRGEGACYTCRVCGGGW